MSVAPVDHYASVIADLEHQRDEITKLIESLRAFRGHQAPSSPEPKNPRRESAVHPAAGEFTGMNMADAAKLRRVDGLYLAPAAIICSTGGITGTTFATR